MEENHVTIHDKLNSMIGPGTKFKGEFELDGLLRIDGDFSGEIRTTGKVVIGSSGRINCKMLAGTVIIGGIVQGEITSTEMVIILSTGIVIGNIVAPRLIIEEGVIFNGTCKITTAIPGDLKKRENGKFDHFKMYNHTYGNYPGKPPLVQHDSQPVLIGK